MRVKVLVPIIFFLNWVGSLVSEKHMFPAGIYLFKVNNGNTRTMCEICSNVILVFLLIF